MSKSPDAFRTISEVAEWLGVQAHVLRFWESKFTQVKPIKRAGGRRYYRPADMLLLGGIRKLLHDDGMSIKEVQAILRDLGIAHVSEMSHGLDAAHPGDQTAGEGGHQDSPESGHENGRGGATPPLNASSGTSSDEAEATAPMPEAMSEPQEQPMSAGEDSPSGNQAFFHQEDLSDTPATAEPAPASAADTEAPSVDLSPAEPSEPQAEEDLEVAADLQADQDTIEDPAGVDAAMEAPQAQEPLMESAADGAPLEVSDTPPEDALEQQPVADTLPAEPEQFMMDLGAPEPDPTVPAIEMPEPAPDLGANQTDMESTAEPVPAASAEVDPFPAPAAEQPATASDLGAETGSEADADNAWQSALDADSSAAAIAESAQAVEPVTPAPVLDAAPPLTPAIDPAEPQAREDMPLADVEENSAAAKPRIIAVADEDLAAQVSLRPGLLALLAQTTEIAPEAQAEVAACAAELRAWVEAH